MLITNEDKVSFTLRVNQHDYRIHARPADILLYVLREELGFTGSKPGCLNGDCGACTVHVDGMPMKSCLMLAVEVVGHEVKTIEAFNDTPIQEAFIEKWGFQCGYCTPGFIMNAHALVNQSPPVSEKMIKEWLQSNICRCTSYQEIQEAVYSVLDMNGARDHTDKEGEKE